MAMNEKEQKFRNGLNVKVEDDKRKYMSSMAKSLYEE